MQNMVDKAVAYLMQYGLSFVYAILIFIIGKWAARFVSRIAGATMHKAKLNETLASFLKNIIYYVLLIFVCIAALNKLGIETTSFVALVGAAGLAVGFWAKVEDLRANWGKDKEWDPKMDPTHRDKEYKGWLKAVTRTFDWTDEPLKHRSSRGVG